MKVSNQISSWRELVRGSYPRTKTLTVNAVIGCMYLRAFEHQIGRQERQGK
jgi:hypothetical protein